MTRYKCVVQYDGYNYVGWQTQCNGLAIQEVIERALQEISKKEISIISSGRTDAKVHARHQVFHFDSDSNMSLGDWKRALNGHLPDDIHIDSVEEVDSNFHSRFHATGKVYEYHINLGSYDVFTRNRMYQCPYKLDLEFMEKCSEIFVGTHDFTTFCGNRHETHPDQVRTVRSISFSRNGDVLVITYEGKGFLRYMVRMLTATLIEAGRHRLTYEDVERMLEARDKNACKWNAKPWGLYLVDVQYND